MGLIAILFARFFFLFFFAHRTQPRLLFTCNDIRALFRTVQRKTCKYALGARPGSATGSHRDLSLTLWSAPAAVTSVPASVDL